MLLRRITQHVKAQNWMAVGLDFLIVVAGILIAFQITNWNASRQEKAALNSYLTSMSKNIEYDLTRIEVLNGKRADVPAADWAVFYIRNRSSAFAEKPAKDFSRFTTLSITMKGAQGGESLLVSVKDDLDPDDGTETRIAVTLSPEWETYEIPLDDFETADLERIFAPINLTFLGGDASASIRDIEFLP